MGCAQATTYDCAPHGHSLPRHSIEIVCIMAIYHHAITWSATILQHGVAPPPTIYYRTTTRRWSTTWHLSSRHNMECDHTTTWGCTTTNHLLPHHQRDDGPRHGHLSPYHNAGYGNAIMWSCVPHGHSSPRHGIEMVRGNMIYRY